MTRILLIAAATAALATAAQAQAGAGHRAHDFDADHDGKVTLEEFKTGQAARMDRLFDRVDANHDGKLSQDELTAAASGPRGGHVAKLSRLAADHAGGISKADLGVLAETRFKKADANHDGWLSADELSNMRQRKHGGQAPE
ncbi:MAG: EF-hand domain-containing protein [Caulobacterales bacterium]|nr:EF-hand domain-containing protein [Caulobacterales bacterium]